MDEYEEYDLKAKIDFKVWKQIFKEMLKYPIYLGMGIFSMMGAAIVETLFLKFVCSDGLARFIGQELGKDFIVFIIEMVMFVLVMGMFTTMFLYFCGTLERLFYVGLTKETFAKLQRQPFSFFDRSSVGWLMARVASDTSRLGEIISWGLIDIVYAFFRVLSVLIIMWTIDWKLSLIIMVIIPIVALVTYFFDKIVIILSRKQRKLNSKITTYLNEGISGAKTSKTLVLEDKNLDEFGKIVHQYKDVTIKTGLAQSSLYQIIAFGSAVCLACMGYFGGMSLNDSTTLFLFLSYSSSFFEPILTIARLSNQMKHAQVSAERVFNLNAITPAILETDEVIEKYGDYLHKKVENWEELKGDITFDHVDFEYKNGKKVLTDFNLEVKQGQSIALVGETGAGKSTIVNLLCRFYEPTTGKILIDGKDYKDRSTAWLHSNLGYVLQTPHLFSGTIKENIRYGNLNATDEQVYEAARIANAEEFILKLEKGYDSDVGEGGNRLSLGQKQLISFARAIIANPRLLILDEATSSIDTETEYTIQKAISNILAGRTSFIVAHRLSTIVNCDQILVIANGKVIEKGNHNELMKLKGYYYKLYTNQFIEEKMKELNF